jgi:prepilin-type N-terminal cleavage/methylation domain-containing protein
VKEIMTLNRVAAAGLARRQEGGFSLIEVMVSITVLLLGVMTAGGVMVTSQQNALFTEQRYKDYADLRNRVEVFKAQVSSTYPSGYTTSTTTQTGSIIPPITTDLKVVNSTTSLGTTAVYTGESCSTSVTVGASGYPNLVRMEMSVSQTGIKPIQVITYVRAGEDRAASTQ